jgi:hypothetical protein
MPNFASWLVVQTQVPSYELVLNGFELVLNGFELVLKSAGGIVWGDSGVEEGGNYPVQQYFSQVVRIAKQ